MENSNHKQDFNDLELKKQLANQFLSRLVCYQNLQNLLKEKNWKISIKMVNETVTDQNETVESDDLINEHEIKEEFMTEFEENTDFHEEKIAPDFDKKNEQNEEQFSCATCTCTFSLKNELEKHILKYHMNTEITSNLVTETLGNQDDTDDKNDHSINKPKIKQENLSEIDLDFTENLNFTESLDFTQSENGSKILNEDQLKAENNPVNENDKEKQINCSKCDRFFYYKSHLDRHISVVHDKSRPYPCTRCERKLCTKRALEIHIERVHDGVTPFSCSHCDSAFPWKEKLRIHIQRVCHHIFIHFSSFIQFYFNYFH